MFHRIFVAFPVVFAYVRRPQAVESSTTKTNTNLDKVALKHAEVRITDLILNASARRITVSHASPINLQLPFTMDFNSCPMVLMALPTVFIALPLISKACRCLFHNSPSSVAYVRILTIKKTIAIVPRAPV